MSGNPLLTARLVRSVTLTPETRHLEFAVEGNPHFDFAAGQFVSMVAPHDGNEITRAYSIASSPRNGSFDVCLNRVDGGFFSNYLCDLQEGAAVQFHGPHGYFVLRHPVTDSLFIGTGTGIAPLRGMIHWLFDPQHPERNRDHQFWLVFGCRYRQDLYYNDEFEQLHREYPNFHYLPTLSRENQAWGGACGYVQDHVRALAEGRTGMTAYICGLKEMVTCNRDLLKQLGWDRKRILYEKFD